METQDWKGFINHQNKDYFAGGLMILLGLGAIVEGTSYHIGTLNKMGSGFFPVALGALLALTGIAIAIGARSRSTDEEKKPLPPEWRGWFCIISSIVAFVVLGKYGGLVPATVAIVFISALGDRQNTIKDALALSLTVTTICIVVFWWALQVQFPLFCWG